jgi:CheY-like chemotaxis protein
MTASVELARKITIPTPIKKDCKFILPTLEQSMSGSYVCPCCSSVLLRHICGSRLYWRCSHCHQEMPAFIRKTLSGYDIKSFPNCRPHQGQKNNHSMQNSSPYRHESSQDINIFVVDNDLDSRHLWTFLLEEYQANVMAFESIKDALASLENFVPDLLICEIRFLGESVIPLIERIKEFSVVHEKTIPILITSTYSSANFIHFFYPIAVEITAYLLKPINVDEFVDTVLKLVFLPTRFHPRR